MSTINWNVDVYLFVLKCVGGTLPVPSHFSSTTTEGAMPFEFYRKQYGRVLVSSDRSSSTEQNDDKNIMILFPTSKHILVA